MNPLSIAIIPARGGSKRIIKKNIKDFFGKPLLAYSIEVAQKSELFEKIIVSTDDEEIAKIARQYGAEVPFLRPKNLSDDFTRTEDVMNHAIEYLEKQGEFYQYICTLYATAPLLEVQYLIEGYETLKNSDAINTFSATSMPFPIQRSFKLDSAGRCEMFTPQYYMTRSQDLEEAYQDAGQFYWESRERKNSSKILFSDISIPIILPRHLVQDIDTLEDWRRVELMYQILNPDIFDKSDNLNILFRADSSSTIGTGHIMRDLVLASQYKNANVTFAVQNLKGNINHKILEAGYKIELLNSNKIKELIKLIRRLSIELIVIDNYKINYKFEKKIKRKTNVQILALDDTYEKHHCDILLNHNISADKKKYKGLVPDNCELRCGSKYTLLRDEFIKEKKKYYEKSKNKKTIFLAMGGADHSNINIQILEVLKEFKNHLNIRVNIVTTTANQNLKVLDKYCKNKKWISLHVNSNKIAKLMVKSDFAIVTPSVVVNEVYFMKIPFIAIKTADNQVDMSEFLKKERYKILMQFNKKNLKEELYKIHYPNK